MTTAEPAWRRWLRRRRSQQRRQAQPIRWTVSTGGWEARGTADSLDQAMVAVTSFLNLLPRDKKEEPR